MKTRLMADEKSREGQTISFFVHHIQRQLAIPFFVSHPIW